MKLNKTQKAAVIRAKQEIEFLTSQQEEIYQIAWKALDLPRDESDWLFDYCYNDADFKTLENL